MNNADLDNALRTLDVHACASALAKLTEKERKQLSGRALEWLLVADHTDHAELKPWLSYSFVLGPSDMPKNIQRLYNLREEGKKLAPQLPPEARQARAIEPARVAVFATCTLTEIKKHNGQPTNADLCYALIKTRQPRWASQWARQMLEECPEIYWKILRRLESEKLVTLEVDSEYLRSMAIGIATAGDIAEQISGDEILKERLSIMLEDDSVSRLFLGERPPGRDQRDRFWNTLQAVGGKWQPALQHLAENGTVPRLRLLKTTLAVLSRLALESSEGASKLNLVWYTRLHDEISLPIEEEETLAEDYIRMLYSRNVATVGWTIGRLKKLVDWHREVPLESICEGLGAVFLVKGKENAIKALDCLSTIAIEIPSARTTVLRATLQALDSESQDIQKRALALIEKFGAGNEEVAEDLQNNLDRIAIVHRQRAQDWLKKQGKTSGIVAGMVTEAGVGAVAGAGAAAGAGAVAGRVTEAGVSAGAGTVTEAGVSAGAGGIGSQLPDLEELLERCSRLPDQLQTAAGIDAAAEAIKSGCADVPALDFAGNEFPRLNPEKAIKQIANFDELVFLLTKLLQDYQLSTDGEAIERALDGMARVGALPPDDFADRVRPIHSTAAMNGVLGNAVRRWLIGPTVQPLLGFGGGRFKPHPIDLIVQCRLNAAARQARERKPNTMLSTPTHEGGWLDPLVLVERTIQRSTESRSQSTQEKGITDLRSLTKAILKTTNYLLGGAESPASREDDEVFDECLAILRLAPDNRQEALELLLAAKLPQSEFINAVRYALGDADIALGDSAPLWAAAARARAPFGNDSEVENKFPGLGPDTGWSARYELRFNTLSETGRLDWRNFKFVGRLPKANSASKPVAIMAALHEPCETDGWGSGFIHQHWASTVCPMLLEGWFAHCVDELARGEHGMTVLAHKRFLEKLYDPDVPLKQMALVTLVLGLSAKEKEVQGAALEALIQAIDDGRLNSDKLAAMLQTLREFERPARGNEYGLQLISLPRYAKSLKTAAVNSPYHALVIARSIELTLKGDPLAPPQHLHALLEVLLEVYVQQQQAITLAESRDYLSGVKTSGKTEKLIKQLLSLKPGANADSIRIDALGYALEKRIERAERWQSWAQQNIRTLSDRKASAVSP